MMKRKLFTSALACILLLSLSACSGNVDYNTVEGSLYDPDAFSASSIVQMSEILEDNILENWYVNGVTPDNFERVMIDELDDTVRGVYQSGYRSWYAAVEEIGYSSPETLAQDISVGDVVYYINDSETLTVEATLTGTGENAHTAVLEYQVDRNKVPLSIAVNVQRSVGEKMANAGLNTLLGMGMAFFVLILISLVISLFAILSGNGKKKSPKKDAAGSAPAAAVQTEASIEKTVSQIAAREDADLEIAAVISAAVAAYEADTGVSGGVVRSIKRASGEELLPQMPDYVPEDGVFIRPVRKREKRNWKKAI